MDNRTIKFTVEAHNLRTLLVLRAADSLPSRWGF